MLHVQDAQWLDRDSRALLNLWIESAELAFPNCRDHRQPQSARRYFRQPSAFKALPIAELDAAGVAELASNALNGAVSAAAARYLFEKASGNPFFTEQLTLDLSEQTRARAIAGWHMGFERRTD